MYYITNITTLTIVKFISNKHYNFKNYNRHLLYAKHNCNNYNKHLS